MVHRVAFGFSFFFLDYFFEGSSSEFDALARQAQVGPSGDGQQRSTWCVIQLNRKPTASPLRETRPPHISRRQAASVIENATIQLDRGSNG
jgi:hypothetical protein